MLPFSMAGTQTAVACSGDLFIANSPAVTRSTGMPGYNIAWRRKSGRTTCGCRWYARLTSGRIICAFRKEKATRTFSGRLTWPLQTVCFISLTGKTIATSRIRHPLLTDRTITISGRTATLTLLAAFSRSHLYHSTTKSEPSEKACAG